MGWERLAEAPKGACRRNRRMRQTLKSGKMGKGQAGHSSGESEGWQVHV